MTLRSLLTSGRCGEGTFDGPVGSESAANDPIVNSSLSGPLGKGLGAAIPLKQDIGAGVVGLLLLGCPPAILRAIPLVIINAVNGMLGGRSWPHVIKEILKAVSPAVTHGNAPAAVVVVSRVVGVSAAIFHMIPHAIFGRIFRAVHFSRASCGEAAAAPFCVASSQRTFLHHPHTSALASAQKNKLFASFKWASYHQSPLADVNARQGHIVHGEPPSKVIRINAGRAVMSRLFAVATPLASGSIIPQISGVSA